MSNAPLILIIDDDAMFRSTICRMVRALGYEAAEAVDGAEGLAFIRQHRVAIALIDMLMPDMDGFETIREIRQLDRDIAIIAMSGGSVAGDGSHWDPLVPARALCADHILNKPFRIDVLQSVIELCLCKGGGANCDGGAASAPACA